MLASDDQGETWQLQRTGQNLPLHGIYFFDAKRGWAVGDGGTILGTVDGGQTWTMQRQGGKRAALLFVHAQPEQTARRYVGPPRSRRRLPGRCPALRGPGPGVERPVQAVADQRFAAGTRLAGGMTGETLWQFPLPQYLLHSDKQAILDYWNRLHAGEAKRQVLRQLVLAVRMWRPSVVVGDAPFPQISGSSRGVAHGGGLASGSGPGQRSRGVSGADREAGSIAVACRTVLRRLGKAQLADHI